MAQPPRPPLSSTFWALVGGAAISLAGATFVTTFQPDVLPELWPLEVAAAVTLAAGGSVWVALSLRLLDNEATLSTLPASMPFEEKLRFGSRLRSGRLRWYGLLGGVLVILALTLFPIKAWVLWSFAASTPTQPQSSSPSVVP